MGTDRTCTGVEEPTYLSSRARVSWMASRSDGSTSERNDGGVRNAKLPTYVVETLLNRWRTFGEPVDALATTRTMVRASIAPPAAECVRKVTPPPPPSPGAGVLLYTPASNASGGGAPRCNSSSASAALGCGWPLANGALSSTRVAHTHVVPWT